MNRLSKWLDVRIDLVGIRRTLLDRRMPRDLTWWHTLGSATLAVFLVQAATGTILAMYYAPSPDHAYDSIRYLEHSVASGALLRGIHHWGASAMVILVVAHAIRVFSMGAYKYPRELNWLLGVALLGIVLGFGFTGYLLPWDQKAYWATQVGTNIAGTTPIVGAVIVKLLRGGTQLGVATLTRFYALHVLLLPALLAGIALLHLTLVVRNGIAPRTGVLELNAPPRTDSPEYHRYYAESYAASKKAGVRFWPDIVVLDAVIATSLVLLLFLVGHFVGAGLELPADPSDSSYVPRPEWYFLPFFQLLKLVPGSMESIAAVGVPGALVLVLVLLPFFDRRSARAFNRRPVARVSLFALLGGIVLLLGASIREPKPTAIAPEVGRVLNSAERAGRALFDRQQCGGCHIVAGKGGADRKGDAKDAPDLTEIGLKHSAAYIHSFIEDPSRFHTGSKMPAFGPPVLSHQEIEELSRYLASLRGKDWQTAKEEFVDTFPEPKKPKEKP